MATGRVGGSALLLPTADREMSVDHELVQRGNAHLRNSAIFSSRSYKSFEVHVRAGEKAYSDDQ